MYAGEETSDWFALRVRPNHERSVNTGLEQRGIESFLPTYRERRSWSDRIRTIERPLFAGYVFCRTAMHRRLPVVTTPGVIDVVGFGKTPTPIPDDEISSIRSLVENRLATSPWPFLKVGERVQIKDGPLSGVEGLLVEFKGGYRLVVSISLLQRSVSVELDGAWVRKV
jgi:transcription antitermination factor NusG